MSQTLNQYKERLENNPKFGYGTVHVYVKAIRELLNLYGEEPEINQMNAFIKKKCLKRQPYVKYAIKEYLFMVDRQADYNQLVQAKVRMPVRPKNFLTKDQLLLIIHGIKKEPYRTIGKLQLGTAARSIGIITLERRKITKQEDKIRLVLKEKGDKPRTVFVRKELWPVIEMYYKEPKKYIFLEKEAGEYSEQRIFTRATTIYKQYLRFLQDSAKHLGFEISTHDIRRSVANMINNSTKDPRVAQKILGHASMDTTEKYLSDNVEQINEILLNHQLDI